MIVTKSEACIYHMISCKCTCMIILNVIIIRIYIIIIFFFFLFFFFFFFVFIFIFCVLFLLLHFHYAPSSPSSSIEYHHWLEGWVNWSDRIWEVSGGPFQSWNPPEISKLFGLMNCMLVMVYPQHTHRQTNHQRCGGVFVELGELWSTYSVESVGSISPV